MMPWRKLHSVPRSAPEKSSRSMKKVTTYHELGHAIVGHLPGSDPP